jgi:serine/threonine-protein kinase
MSAEQVHEPSELDDLPALPAFGALIDGRYYIESELGRGGMGVVLGAHDRMLDRRVALKVLMPKLMRSPEAVARFGNEARSLARLESRHVVRVLDYGNVSSPPECCGLPFMVLELLHGEDLYTVTSREGPLSPSRVVHYALQACAGLAAAHAQGIVHRDLKPENLFLAIEPDGSECVKVLDFGIARSRSRRVRTQGHGVGSPGYMAPEQVEGAENVDARADIWALGVVMYELLAQRPAFVGENAQSLCLQILTAQVTPIGELCPNLPAALGYIVERCMERDPNRRFQNVAELAQALAPLDSFSPESEADLIRRRLEFSEKEPVSDVRPRPMLEVVTEETEALPAPRSRVRRALSFLVAALILVPILALLPRVIDAPELAPARAWSGRVIEQTQHVYAELRERAHELWLEHKGEKPIETAPH